MSLAESLNQDGFDAWTPIETRVVRVPRMNVKREVRLPIMPSYVFARAHHLVDLLELATMPVKPRRGKGRLQPAHADFSVMHYFDKIPVVRDTALTELRRIEAKRTPRPKADRAYPRGSLVRVEGGSFGGLTGEVQRSDRSHTVVCINEKFTVKIATFLLHPDELYVANTAALEAA